MWWRSICIFYFLNVWEFTVKAYVILMRCLWRNITIMIDSLLEATFNSNLFDQVAKIRCSIFGIKINITRSVPEREKKSRLIQLLSTVYQQIKKSKKNDQSRNRV